MVIIESKFEPGDFVFFVTAMDQPAWLVSWVGQDVNRQTVYGLCSGPETAVAFEFELIAAVNDKDEQLHLGAIEKAEGEDTEPEA